MAQSTETDTMAAETSRDHSPAPNALKRPQSAIAEEEEGSKRQRISPGKDSPKHPTQAGEEAERGDNDKAVKKEDSKTDSPQDTTNQQPAAERRGSDTRRKGSVIDEKQRSKRLFGGFLGNLAKPANTVSKRRQEIEARRKAELQRQDDERVEDKQKRAELSAVRRKQVKKRVDEHAMRVRHDQELRNAHFLQTKAEPKLYYKPWELLPSQEDLVDDQIRDTESRIDRERDEFESSQQSEQSPVAERTTRPSPDITRPADKKMPIGEGHEVQETSKENGAATEGALGIEKRDTTETAATTRPAEDAEASTVPVVESADAAAGSAAKDAAQPAEKETAEHDEDHMVEGEEDTVIY